MKDGTVALLLWLGHATAKNPSFAWVHNNHNNSVTLPIPTTSNETRIDENYGGMLRVRKLQTLCGDGNRGNGVCADDGYCCSKWGYCGPTAEYCSGTDVVGTCGNGTRGNGICADGSCCSQWGWCDSSSAHCSGVTMVPTNSPSQAITSSDEKTRSGWIAGVVAGFVALCGSMAVIIFSLHRLKILRRQNKQDEKSLSRQSRDPPPQSTSMSSPISEDTTNGSIETTVMADVIILTPTPQDINTGELHDMNNASPDYKDQTRSVNIPVETRQSWNTSRRYPKLLA